MRSPEHPGSTAGLAFLAGVAPRLPAAGLAVLAAGPRLPVAVAGPRGQMAVDQIGRAVAAVQPPSPVVQPAGQTVA